MRVERVMTDNGLGYRSGEFNALLELEGARHVYTGAQSLAERQGRVHGPRAGPGASVYQGVG